MNKIWQKWQERKKSFAIKKEKKMDFGSDNIFRNRNDERNIP